MATSVQIVFDCANPDRLGAFWAEALHYKQQGPPPGFASWEAFLRDRGVPEGEWNSANAIVDPEKVGPRIYFQKMDTPKPTKNRVHLDLNVSGGGRAGLEERVKRVNTEVERILELGATKQREWEEPDGTYWVVMLDPEGNEFCIQ